MKYRRMPIEIESPEQMGYENVKYNLTESSVTDLVIKEIPLSMKGLVLCYGHHVGHLGLRNLISSESEKLTSDDVLLTAGAAAALFIAATTLLNKEDHIIVTHPNYATNIETPLALGCDISLLKLTHEKKYKIDIEELEKLIKPQTKLISITSPHNPTGTMLELEELLQIVRLAEKHNCYLLVDETYRELAFIWRYPVAASLSDKVISISSVSKAYGLPGLRIGWLICKDKELMNTFLAAKEQIYVCNSVLDEELAYTFLQNRAKLIGDTKEHVKRNSEILEKWLENESHILDYILPVGGVVCFPRIKKETGIDTEKFYDILNNKYHTFVGPGHWFDMPKNYFRIGFGWPKEQELRQGLENISRAFRELL